MTPEQIQEYLNKIQNPGPQEGSDAMQNDSRFQAPEQTPSQAPATGVYNPGDYDLQKMFVNQQNEKYKNKSGAFTPAMSLNKGDSFQKYLDKKLTPELQQELFADIQSVADRQAGKGYQLNKHDLREVEAAFKAKHPEIKRLDISGWRGFDKAMASDLNQIVQTKKPEEKPTTNTQPVKQETQPAQTETKPTATPPQKTEKPKGKQVENSNKGVAGAQVGDYIVRKNGETHVITQGDIDWAKKRVGEQQPTQQTTETPAETPAETSSENTNDDEQFLAQYKQYLDQLSKMQPRSQAATMAMMKSEAYKFVNNPANKERYNKLKGFDKKPETQQKESKLTTKEPGKNMAMPASVPKAPTSKPADKPTSQTQKGAAPDYNAVEMTQQMMQKKADDLGAMAQTPQLSQR